MGMVEEIGTFLSQAGISLSPAVNLFYGQRPDAPDDVLALYEYQGEAPEFDHGSTLPEWEGPHLQIVSRSFDPQLARDRLRQAYLALSPICSLGNQQLWDDSGHRTTYRKVQPIQQPFQIGRDENRRYLWACNFQIIRRPVPD